MRPSVPKWPFFLGDAILLGLAYFIYWQGATPLPLAEIAPQLEIAGKGKVSDLAMQCLDQGVEKLA